MTSSEPGPLTDEAARLIGAAQDWWHRTVGDPATARIATGSPECCWCPLCQLIAALRGERPELLERLAETQAALTATLRALAEAAGLASTFRPDHADPDDAAPDDAAPDDAAPDDAVPADQPVAPADRKPRGSRVQPIPLDDGAG